MLRALWRIIVLPIAFVLAAGVTLFVIFSLGQERAVQAVTGRGPEPERLRCIKKALRNPRSFAANILALNARSNS